MLRMADMKMLEVVNKAFIKAKDDGIKLIPAKVIDDFLIAGYTHDIQEFFKDLLAEFEVINTSIGGNFLFNGC